jgi:hypothetical protein
MRNRAGELDVAHDPEQSAGNRPLHPVPGRRVGLRSAAADKRHTRRRGKMGRAGPFNNIKRWMAASASINPRSSRRARASSSPLSSIRSAHS